jgi:hypothetical protein
MFKIIVSQTKNTQKPGRIIQTQKPHWIGAIFGTLVNDGMAHHVFFVLPQFVGWFGVTAW